MLQHGRGTAARRQTSGRRSTGEPLANASQLWPTGYRHGHDCGLGSQGGRARPLFPALLREMLRGACEFREKRNGPADGLMAAVTRAPDEKTLDCSDRNPGDPAPVVRVHLFVAM